MKNSCRPMPDDSPASVVAVRPGAHGPGTGAYLPGREVYSAMAEGESLTEKMPRIVGFDYLRAILSVFVVFYHFEILDKSAIFDKTLYMQHRFTWTDFFYFHVLLLAVPTFILMSNYLFALKRPGLKELARTVRRILLLLLFWPVAYVLWKHGYSGFRAFIPRSFPQAVELFFSCGYTVYYFFISLIFTSVLVFLYRRFSSGALAGILALSCLILMAMPLIAVKTGSYKLTAYWNPVNFMAYPPAALLISRFSRPGSAGMPGRPAVAAILLLAGGVLLACLEWTYYPDAIHFLGQGHAMPMYTRASLVFSSSLILLAALHPKRAPIPVVSFMSAKSLALYCLHPFFIGVAQRGVGKVASVRFAHPSYIAFVLVILLSYIGSALLSFYFKREVLA